MPEGDADPPAEAERLVRDAVSHVLERHIAGSPRARSDDLLTEILAEAGALALTALSEPIPDAAVRPEFVDLDPRRFVLRLAEVAPAGHVNGHGRNPAEGPALWEVS